MHPPPGGEPGKSLWLNDQLRRQLNYCVPLGIPWSKFLGWDPVDQDLALDWVDAQRQVCACGTRRAEWDSDSTAYVGFIDQCPGCELIEMERQNVPEGMKGAKVGLMPKWQALQQLDSLGSNDMPPAPPAEVPGL